MAQQVYTVRLWSLPSMPSSGTAQGPGPPSGFIWVVRDVRVINLQGAAAVRRAPIVLTTSTSVYVAQSPAFSSLAGVLYQWQGRAVVPAGESLVASSSTLGWQLVADGYQLSLP